MDGNYLSRPRLTFPLTNCKQGLAVFLEHMATGGCGLVSHVFSDLENWHVQSNRQLGQPLSLGIKCICQSIDLRRGFRCLN